MKRLSKAYAYYFVHFDWKTVILVFSRECCADFLPGVIHVELMLICPSRLGNCNIGVIQGVLCRFFYLDLTWM